MLTYKQALGTINTKPKPFGSSYIKWNPPSMGFSPRANTLQFIYPKNQNWSDFQALFLLQSQNTYSLFLTFECEYFKNWDSQTCFPLCMYSNKGTFPGTVSDGQEIVNVNTQSNSCVLSLTIVHYDMYMLLLIVLIRLGNDFLYSFLV